MTLGAAAGLMIGVIFFLVESATVSRAMDPVTIVIQLVAGLVGGLAMGLVIRYAANR